MSEYIERARAALKLARKGKTPVEIKVALDFRYASDANRAVNIGLLDAQFEEARLSEDEVFMLRSVAAAERAALERGDGCSPKLKYIGGGQLRGGRSARIARKRLETHRKGEGPTSRGSGLGLVHTNHGGYVRLTRAGWALVHFLEAQGKAQ